MTLFDKIMLHGCYHPVMVIICVRSTSSLLVTIMPNLHEGHYVVELDMLKGNLGAVFMTVITGIYLMHNTKSNSFS